MFILDTDTLSELFKGRPNVRERLASVPGNTPVVTTLISRIEILEGRFAAIAKAANRVELLNAAARLANDEVHFESTEVLPLSEIVADEFERVRGNKKLKKIGRKDLLIACFALAHKATLVTRNTKDLRRNSESESCKLDGLTAAKNGWNRLPCGQSICSLTTARRIPTLILLFTDC